MTLQRQRIQRSSILLNVAKRPLTFSLSVLVHIMPGIFLNIPTVLFTKTVSKGLTPAPPPDSFAEVPGLTQ